MIRRCLRLQFAFSDKPKKDSHNPTFAEKVKILNNMKPYIIPFINKNSMVTKCLLKSYLYLIFSKFCFFGGPLLLKQGINQLQNSASLGDPLLMFFGYGVCYSASVLF